MQMYRRAAIELELKRKKQKTSHMCSASPNMLPTSPSEDLVASAPRPPSQQPQLIVSGRNMQQLQLSETLIYDNKRNSIIKFVKSNKLGRVNATSSLHSLHLPEEPPPMWPQTAAFREAPTTCHSASIILADKPKRRPVVPKSKSSPRSLPKPAASRKSNQSSKRNVSAAPRDDTIKQLLDVEHKLKEQSFNAGRGLHRFNTSPALSRLTSGNVQVAEKQQSLCPTGNTGQHERLWRRYNSYPPYGLVSATAPISPNLLCQSVSKPSLAISIVNTSSIPNTLPCTSHAQPEAKANAKTLSGSQLRNASSASSCRMSKRTPRASSSVSYTAHACSHANADGTNSDNGTPMSSTQRRLSYDPRATLKRATRSQRSSGSSSPAVGTSRTLPRATSSSSCGHSDVLRRKILTDKMEQE